MADQRQPRLRVGRAQVRDEIGEIVVELADVADVTARPRGTVTARVEGDRRDPGRGERLSDHVHFVGGGRGAVGDDRQPVGVAVRGRIKPIGQPGAVARLKAGEFGLAFLVDRHRAGMDRGQRRRLGQGRSEQKRQRQRGEADEREEPDGQLQQAGKRHRADPCSCNSMIQSSLQ
jgi:hypothetical protein